jgi:hypothetical protein
MIKIKDLLIRIKLFVQYYKLNFNIYNINKNTWI